MKWFLLQNEQVQGPFSTDEVEARFKQSASDLKCLIWGRHQKDWMSFDHWKSNLPKLAELVPVTRKTRMWHFALNGESKGPFTRDDLIEHLRLQEKKHDVLLWTQGMADWVPLFEFHEFLDSLGINRREHPRAPILGRVAAKTEDQQSLIGQLVTISEGGCGVKGFRGLRPGQVLTLDLQSEHLKDSIRVRALVRYTSEDDITGLRFEGLHVEARSRIIDYVKNQGRATEDKVRASDEKKAA